MGQSLKLIIIWFYYIGTSEHHNKFESYVNYQVNEYFMSLSTSTCLSKLYNFLEIINLILPTYWLKKIIHNASILLYRKVYI